MVHFKSCDSITLFIFVLRFPLKRLSIQYVYERVLLVFSVSVNPHRVSLEAGAKVQLLFNLASV